MRPRSARTPHRDNSLTSQLIKRLLLSREYLLADCSRTARGNALCHQNSLKRGCQSKRHEGVPEEYSSNPTLLFHFHFLSTPAAGGSASLLLVPFFDACAILRTSSMASKLMSKKSPAFLELARLRLRDRFKSKFLNNAAPIEPGPLSMTANSIPKIDVASAILVDEMSPNHLEEARYRIRSCYQDYLGRFLPSRHTEVMLNYPIAIPLGNSLRATDNEYIEAARMRLRARFQKKFMPPSEEAHVVEEIIADTSSEIDDEDEFAHFPTTVIAIPEALASSWGQNSAIVITSAQSPFQILHVNQPWTALCGYTKDEAAGQTFKSLGINAHGITERDRVEEMMAKLNHGQRASVRLTNLTKDGAKFSNYLRIAPVEDEITGEVTRFLGVLEDVTEKKTSVATA